MNVSAARNAFMTINLPKYFVGDRYKYSEISILLKNVIHIYLNVVNT